MSELIESEDFSALKAAFLVAYTDLRTPKLACEKVKIKRSQYQSWLSGDDNFRAEFFSIKAGIMDECDLLLMKHAGIIMWTKAERDRGVYKFSNVRSIELLKRDNGMIGSTDADQRSKPMTLPIAGISPEDVKKLITPDAKRIAEAKPIDVEVVIEGTPEKKKPLPGIAEMLRRKRGDKKVEA